MLNNTPNQLSKFRKKNWIEINDQLRGVYNVNGDIRLKSTMLKSSFCDYSNACILVEGRITITGAEADAAARQVDKRDKGVVFKDCAPFIRCETEINNTEIDNAKDIDTVMPMYNLIEYSDHYSKTFESLWQYYRNESNHSSTDSESFKSKIKITGKTANNNNNTKDVEVIVPLNY